MPFGSIKIRYPDGTDESYEIADRIVWVGSASHNNLFVDDESVSRQHARLDVTDSGLTVQDLGSAEGTFVHGQRLEVGDTRLLTGREPVRFGDVEVRFAPVATEEAAPPQAPPEQAAERAAAETDVPAEAQAETPPEQAAAASATPSVAPPVPPKPDAPQPRREPPTVRMEGPALPVVPGESVHAKVTVGSRSNVSEEFLLVVKGLPTGWVSLPQQRVSLPPFAELALPLAVHPPRSSQTVSGDVAFAVDVEPAVSGVQGASSGGRLRVLPFHEAAVSLSPPASTRDFGVVARNLGNERQAYDLSAEDPTRSLEFRLATPTLALDAGQDATVPLRVAAASGSGGGPWDTQEFSVILRRQGTAAPQAQARGRLILTGRQAPWGKLIGGAVAALAAIAVLAALYALVVCPGSGLPMCPEADAPVIESFEARTEGGDRTRRSTLTAAPGEMVVFWWVVSARGDASVELAEDGGETLTGLDLADRAAKYPMWTTTFTLRVEGDDGTASEESLTVEVNP